MVNETKTDDREEVWIAAGLRKPFRVCSMQRTFGEFDSEGQAQTFRDLLIEGNPQMKALA